MSSRIFEKFPEEIEKTDKIIDKNINKKPSYSTLDEGETLLVPDGEDNQELSQIEAGIIRSRSRTVL